MKEKVLHDGEVKINTFTRGPPLVHSRPEWRRIHVKYLIWLTIPSQLFVLFLFGILYLPFSQNEDVLEAYLSIMVFFFPLFYLTIMIGLLLQVRKYPPGIYEFGIQHPENYFIPYDEIIAIELRPPKYRISDYSLYINVKTNDRSINDPYYSIISGKIIKREHISMIVDKIQKSVKLKTGLDNRDDVG